MRSDNTACRTVGMSEETFPAFSDIPTFPQNSSKPRMALGRTGVGKVSDNPPTFRQSGYVHSLKHGKMVGTIHRNAPAMLATSEGATPKGLASMLDYSIPDPDEEANGPVLDGNVSYPSAEMFNAPPARNGLGFVYLVECAGVFKIGISSDIRRRMRQIAAHCPRRLKVLHYVQTHMHNELELILHDRFKHRRSHGEWFLLDDEEAYAVYSLMNHWCELSWKEWTYLANQRRGIV